MSLKTRNTPGLFGFVKKNNKKKTKKKHKLLSFELMNISRRELIEIIEFFRGPLDAHPSPAGCQRCVDSCPTESFHL